MFNCPLYVVPFLNTCHKHKLKWPSYRLTEQVSSRPKSAGIGSPVSLTAEIGNGYMVWITDSSLSPLQAEHLNPRPVIVTHLKQL